MGNFPPSVAQLVARFAGQADHYVSPAYNETLCRIEFINPFFAELGWDVDNHKGYADAYREVYHEDAVKVGSATKAPDYSFRIGGQRKFFLEAKKPGVNLKNDPLPAYQLRRYAWSAKLPLSILTDFEEFAVYDCRALPSANDKPSEGRIFYCRFDEYEKHWDYLASTFSPDAILKGSFDKYAQTAKGKRGTAEVDAAFLAEIETWREILAKAFAKDNTLAQRDLNFAVQRTIDRVIFLRICEDRGIEPYGQLLALSSGPAIYPRLCELFRRGDEKYNSGIFHFHKEKDRHETPDELTPGLSLDDKPLKDILKNLYYPHSPYEFSVITADILGQVYEQFLGKVIRLTSEHRATVEEKPEVRKAGGVYYTPTYIVDYIVQNTVGKLLGPSSPASAASTPSPANAASSPSPASASSAPSRHKPNSLVGEGRGEGSSAKPQSLTPKEAAKLKILDPACGSGSFLIGAYQYLLDWHAAWYAANSPEKFATGRNPAVYQGKGGAWRLTMAARKAILINNIYGVDIDPQAVETTKLSLLLKVLEGESQETLDNQMKLFRERALPDLGNNIKCGNSLVGPDFYDNAQMMLLGEEEKLRVNVFDWKREFASLVASSNGTRASASVQQTVPHLGDPTDLQPKFDAIIGNPPWGADLTDEALAYMRTRYRRVIDRMVDSYIYFIDKSLRHLRPRGMLGFIIPSTILNQVDASAVRRILLGQGIACLINMGKDVFTKKVLNTSTILITATDPEPKQFVAGDLCALPLEARQSALGKCEPTDWGAWHAIVTRDPHCTFFAKISAGMPILDRLRAAHPALSAVLNGAIQRGVSPDVAAAHVLSDADQRAAKIEATLLRRSLSGAQIKRYAPWTADQWIIYTSRETPIDEFPNAAQHLRTFRERNTCREVEEGKHPYWALHRPRDPSIFRSPKFIGLTTTKRIELIYDAASDLCVTDAMYVFQIRAEFDSRLCMAILHSRLFLFLYRVANQGESRVIPQVKASKLETLPFPAEAIRRDSQRAIALVSLVDQMLSLQQQRLAARTPHAQDSITRQVDATDARIDALVYQLYGLTDAEIAIIESATSAT